jgi:hypothetical protein
MIGTILMLSIHLRNLARNGRRDGWGHDLPLEDLVYIWQMHLDTVLALVPARLQVFKSFGLVEFFDDCPGV